MLRIFTFTFYGAYTILCKAGASFTESKEFHMTPGGSLEEKTEPRLGHSWQLPQEETSEEKHDDGVSETSSLKCVKEVGF